MVYMHGMYLEDEREIASVQRDIHGVQRNGRGLVFCKIYQLRQCLVAEVRYPWRAKFVGQIKFLGSCILFLWCTCIYRSNI